MPPPTNVDDVINAGKVRCGVVLDFPPIGYRDQDNDPAGLDVTLTTKQTTQLI